MLKQSGVNGEKYAQEIIETNVEFANRMFKVPIFANNTVTDNVDGYVGMGFLRAFDILFTNANIGFKYNNNDMRNIDFYTRLASSGSCDIGISCHRK